MYYPWKIKEQIIPCAKIDPHRIMAATRIRNPLVSNWKFVSVTIVTTALFQSFLLLIFLKYIHVSRRISTSLLINNELSLIRRLCLHNFRETLRQCWFCWRETSTPLRGQSKIFGIHYTEQRRLIYWWQNPKLLEWFTNSLRSKWSSFSGIRPRSPRSPSSHIQTKFVIDNFLSRGHKMGSQLV